MSKDVGSIVSHTQMLQQGARVIIVKTDNVVQRAPEMSAVALLRVKLCSRAAPKGLRLFHEEASWTARNLSGTVT